MKPGDFFVKFGADVTELEKAFSRVERGLKKTAESAKRTGDMLSRNITAPLVAVAGAFTLAMTKAMSYADEIDKMSIRTGLAAESLQELQFVTDQVGVEFGAVERAIDSFRRRLPQIEQGTGRAATNMHRLGVNVRDTDGQMRSMNDLFPELIRRLANVENETERGALAVDIFGRSASNLAPLLAQGEQGIQHFVEQAHDLGLVLEQDTIEELVEFKDEISKVQQQLGAAGRELGRAFLPLIRDELIPALQDSLIPALRAGVEWFRDLDDSTKKNILAVAGLAAVLGPTLSILGRMVPVVMALSKALMANPWIIAAAGVAELTRRIVVSNRHLRQQRELVEDMIGMEISTGASDSELLDYLEQQARALSAINELIMRSEAMFKSWNAENTDAARNRIGELQEQRDAIIEQIKKIGILRAALIEQAAAQDEVTESNKAATRSTEQMLAQLAELRNMVGSTVMGFDEFTQQADNLADDMHILEAIFNQSADAVATFHDIMGRASLGVGVSVGEINRALLALNHELNESFSPSRIERIQDLIVALEQLRDTIQGTADQTERLSDAALLFGRTLSTALDAGIIRGRQLSSILDNILRQLASRALTGLILGGLGAAFIPGLGFGGAFVEAFFTGMVGGRSSGGKAGAGNYLVGESGPEIVSFGQPAQVTPIPSQSDLRVRIIVGGEFTARGGDLVAVIDRQNALYESL